MKFFFCYNRNILTGFYQPSGQEFPAIFAKKLKKQGEDMQKGIALKEAGLFFGLTLGLSYFVFWGPLALFQIPTISFVSNIQGPWWAIALFVAGGFVPSLVGILLIRIREGMPGLRRLWQRMIQFKIGWRWYLALILAVILPTLGQLLIIRVLGQNFEYVAFLTQLGSALPLIILGPLSEELGWRGFALDRLQAKWNALVSGLLVGIVWGLWHLPLFFMVGTSQHESNIPFLGFLGGTMALSVLFTWLQNNTGGSLWTAILFHWLYTYEAQVVSSTVIRSPVYNWLEYVPFIITALVVTVIWGPRTLRLKPQQMVVQRLT
jgi:membrane protease YdiL (CAAX protease family)